MKLRLPLKLYSLLMSTFTAFTLFTQSSHAAADGFSINFYNESRTLAGQGEAGAVKVIGDNWSNINTPGDLNLITKSNLGATLYGVTVQSSRSNMYQAQGSGTTDAILLGSYIDAGTGNPYQVTIQNVPYLVSTVYIIMAGDGNPGETGSGNKFTAMSVNGVNYTGSGSDTVQGNGVWGTRVKAATEIVEGTNLLVVDNVTGQNIVIGNVTNGNGRGTLAGIQVIDAYEGLRRDLTLTANGNWTGAGAIDTWSLAESSSSWIDSSAGSGYYAYITSTVAGGGTLTIDGATPVTTDAIILAGDSSSDLTITGGQINLIGPSVLRVDNAALTMNINSTINGQITLDGQGKVKFADNTVLASLNGGGNLLVDDNLTFNPSADNFFDGHLVGNGTVIKQGTNTQGIGDISQFNGSIQITEGTLASGSAIAPITNFNSPSVNFSGNGVLALYLSTNGDSSGDGTVILPSDFQNTLRIAQGVFALNLQTQDKITDIGQAKLQMENGTVFLIRNPLSSDADFTFSNDLQINGSVTLRIYGSNNLGVISSTVTGASSSVLTHTDGGTVVLSGDWTGYSGAFYGGAGTTIMTGSDRTFSNMETSGQGIITIKDLDVTIANDLRVYDKSTTNIENSTVLANSLITTNMWGFESATGNTLNIKDGSVLTITGNKNNDADPKSGNVSVMLGNHNSGGKSTVNIDNATLNALEAVIYMSTRTTPSEDYEGRRGQAHINMTNGAYLNALGINIRLATNTLTLAGNSHLNLGAKGLYGDKGIVTFKGATLGSIDSTGWSSSTNLILAEEGGIEALTVNTGLFDVSSSTYTDTGSTITLSGSITGTGNIVKTGAGTLVLSGTNTFTGAVHLLGGTLSVKDDAMGADGNRKLHILAGAVGSAAPVILADGGTLTINAFTMQDGARLDLGGNIANTLSVAGDVSLSNGTLVFSTGDRFNINGALNVANSLTFSMSLAGYSMGDQIVLGSVTGALTGLDKIIVSDPNASSPDYRPTVGVVSREADNSLVATISGGVGSLQWTDANTTWDLKMTGNWQNIQGADDQLFWQGDNVTFADLTAPVSMVQVSGSVLPANMTLANETTEYLFGGGNITVTGAFSKTGSGLWNVQSGASLTIQGAFSMTPDTLGMLGGTLDLSGSAPTSINLGILQSTFAGSKILFGDKTLTIGLDPTANASDLLISGTGDVLGTGSNALSFASLEGNRYAGTAGLNITGTITNTGDIGIYGGGLAAQTAASGAITIGTTTGTTTLDFGTATSQTSRGIFGAAYALGDAGSITQNVLTNISLIGTRTDDTSNTTVTGRIYGGGAQGVDIYGSTSLSLDGIRFNGSGAKVDEGAAVLLAGGGMGATVHGNATLSVADSYIDSVVYGTAGAVGGNLSMTFNGSVMNQAVYAGGYAAGSVIGGNTSLTAVNTMFNAGIFGGNDGLTTGKMTISLTGSTVTGNVYAGYSVFTEGVDKITGGAEILIHDTTVTGMVGLSTKGKDKIVTNNIIGDSSITISGNSVVSKFHGLGMVYGGLTGDLTINIMDNAVIGEGMNGQDVNEIFMVTNQDGAMTGNATLNVSGGTIKNEYLAFASIGNTGINGNAKLNMTGGTIESNIRAAATWGSTLNGNFDLEISGGTLGKAGATRSIIGGTDMNINSSTETKVTGNVSIKLDGGIDGKGATFLGDYYIHAGSRASSGIVAGNTLVTLSNVTALGGVSAMSGVISGADGNGTGVGGTERKLVFDNYMVEANAQFQYFTLAEVINGSTVTLKGTSSNIDAWSIKDTSAVTIDSMARLGAPSTVTLASASALNLNLAADDAMGSTTLMGGGSFNVSGSHTLTVTADNSAFEGNTTIAAGTTVELQGGTLGGSTAATSIGGTLKVTGGTTAAQQLSGSGTLQLALANAGDLFALTNTASNFSGTLALDKGVLDLAGGTAMSGLTATVAADASLKLNGNDLSKFTSLTGTGNLVAAHDISYDGAVLGGFGGTVKVAEQKTFTLTRTDTALSGSLNNGVTLSLNNDSYFVFSNQGTSLWAQTVGDIVNPAGTANITLEGAQGVQLTVTGSNWTTASSLNFNLDDLVLHEVFVDSSYESQTFYNLSITNNSEISMVIVSGGKLTPFSDFTELPVTVGSAYDSSIYYKVTGANRTSGTTTTTVLESALVEAKGLKITADATLNERLELNATGLELGSGGLLFEGTADYTIANGTITTSASTSNLLIRSAANNLTIESTIGAAAEKETLIKDGPGSLTLTGATHLDSITVNGGGLSLAGTATADGASTLVKENASLTIANQSGITSFDNSGTINLNAGAGLAAGATMVNNSIVNVNVGTGNTINQLLTTGNGTVNVNSGTLAATKDTLGATQAYNIATDGTLSIAMGGSNSAFASSITGAGTFELGNTANMESIATDFTGFTGTIRLKSAASAYRVKVEDSLNLGDNLTIVVENNAQYWDNTTTGTNNYTFYLTGGGQENRGALRTRKDTDYAGTIHIVGAFARLGSASTDNFTVSGTVISDDGGVLELGANSSNGNGIITVTGDNSSLAGVNIYNATKIVATHAHALGGHLTLSGSNGAQALQFDAAMELAYINGFAAGKTMQFGTGGSLTLNGSQDSNLAGTISGAGALTLNGSGNVSLSGNNTYSGGTVISGAQVSLSGNAAALGTGAVSLNAGSLNMGGVAATNALTAKHGTALSGAGAYNGALVVTPDGTPDTALAVTGDLKANSIDLSNADARVIVTGGGVTIANGGKLTLDGSNAYDETTNPLAFVSTTGAVSINGIFAMTFDTNLKSGLNEFKIFSGTSYAGGNNPTVQYTHDDEYLKTFFVVDTGSFGSTGSIFITRNTPDAIFVNQSEVDAMTDYQAREWTAIGARATGTADSPVNLNKPYVLPSGTSDYLFSNGQGWLNVQTELSGSGNRTVMYEYSPGNGADPVTDDRGVILSNNSNSFDGGLLAHNVHIVADGSLAANAGDRPTAGSTIGMLGTGKVELGGNSAVLELRPLGTGNTDNFTVANEIGLRDGASVIQTGGSNTLTGDVSVVAGSVTIANKTASDMTLSGNVSAASGTTLNLDGKLILNGQNGKGNMNASTLAVSDGSSLNMSNGATLNAGLLQAGGAALNVGTGSALTLNGDGNTIQTLTGNGSVTLNNAGLLLNGNNRLDAAVTGSGILSVADNSTLTLGRDQNFGNGILLDMGDTGTLDLYGHTLEIGRFNSGGDIILSDGSLILTGDSFAYGGNFIADGTVELKSGNALTLTGSNNYGTSLLVTSGEIILRNLNTAISSLKYANLQVGPGKMTILNDVEATGLTVNQGGTLTLGNIIPGSSARTARAATDNGPVQVRIAGNAAIDNGSTINMIIPSNMAQITATGSMTLADKINVNLYDNDSGKFASPPDPFILFSANGGFVNDSTGTQWANGTTFDNWNVTLQGSIGLFYTASQAYIDGRQVKVNAVGSTRNVLNDYVTSSVSQAGANLIWDAGLQADGTVLRNLVDYLMDEVNAGRGTSISNTMAAAAGSTVTAMSIAQRDGLRNEMYSIRNRTTQMGRNLDYLYDDEPTFNMWLNGTGGYSKLDSDGHESGYRLDSWGGTVGFDVNLSDYFTMGAAFSANYGKLKADAADHAEGDLDSYYVSLFARAQYKAWAHTVILTGGWNDANLNRTVNYAGGSYTGRGDTTGSSLGAMYELTYDIAMNKKKTAIIQPLFNASIVTTSMDGYDESGAGNAGLHVDDMDMTTGSIALGARLIGVLDSDVFGRESTGELRVNVAQDMGDRRAAADVGFMANPAFRQRVDGAKMGATAIQVGAGLNIPVSDQGTIFVDGSGDFRSGATSVNGTLGYRYSF